MLSGQKKIGSKLPLPLKCVAQSSGLSALEQEKSSLEKLIARQIRSHPTLAANERLLCTIKGIGSVTAAVLLAEMVGPDQVARARQAAAHAGLSPRREQSGTSVRRDKGIGKQGNLHLRKALYMPALVAIKYNQPLKAFAQRLSAAGKPKMAVVCAIMRKLIHMPSACSNISNHLTPL